MGPPWQRGWLSEGCGAFCVPECRDTLSAYSCKGSRSHTAAAFVVTLKQGLAM
jgi:hypothetical protein